MIPKVIYQTWITKNLPKNVIEVRNKIQRLNPNYTMILFDDNDMDKWIKENFDESTYNCYNCLTIGAAKADLWRYLILYKNGGIYLDIDSNIIGSLDELINEDDSAIISREGNELGTYLQWCLMFSPEHPILRRTIDNCIKNIMDNIKKIPLMDTGYFTGPFPFTAAVQEIMVQFYYDKHLRLFDVDDNELNNYTNNLNNSVRCRFYKIDYPGFCQFEHPYKKSLYQEANVNHWMIQQQINKMNYNRNNNLQARFKMNNSNNNI